MKIKYKLIAVVGVFALAWVAVFATQHNGFNFVDQGNVSIENLWLKDGNLGSGILYGYNDEYLQNGTDGAWDVGYDESGTALGVLNLVTGSASPADADTIVINFKGEDSSSRSAIFAREKVTTDDITATTLDGSLVWGVVTNGSGITSVTDELVLTGAALYPYANGGLDLGTASYKFGSIYGGAASFTGACTFTGTTTVNGNFVTTGSSTSKGIANTGTLVNTGTATITGTTTVNGNLVTTGTHAVTGLSTLTGGARVGGGTSILRTEFVNLQTTNSATVTAVVTALASVTGATKYNVNPSFTVNSAGKFVKTSVIGGTTLTLTMDASTTLTGTARIDYY